MARWVQRWNEELGKSEFIPRDEAAARRDSSAAIHGPIEAFVSPVDGSVISDRKQLREHNKRNGVVNFDEFGTDHWDNKRKERDRLYTGDRTKEQIRADRMQINEIINHHERQGR